MYTISRFNEKSSQMEPLMFIDMKSQLQNMATLTFFTDGTRKWTMATKRKGKSDSILHIPVTMWTPAWQTQWPSSADLHHLSTTWSSAKVIWLPVLFPDGTCFPALSGTPELPTGLVGGPSVCPDNITLHNRISNSVVKIRQMKTDIMVKDFIFLFTKTF